MTAYNKVYSAHKKAGLPLEKPNLFFTCQAQVFFQ